MWSTCTWSPWFSLLCVSSVSLLTATRAFRLNTDRQSGSLLPQQSYHKSLWLSGSWPYESAERLRNWEIMTVLRPSLNSLLIIWRNPTKNAAALRMEVRCLWKDLRLIAASTAVSCRTLQGGPSTLSPLTLHIWWITEAGWWPPLYSVFHSHLSPGISSRLQ